MPSHPGTPRRVIEFQPSESHWNLLYTSGEDASGRLDLENLVQAVKPPIPHTGGRKAFKGHRSRISSRTGLNRRKAHRSGPVTAATAQASAK